MKTVFAFLIYVVFISNTYALPQCEGVDETLWNKCRGTSTAFGNRYVGEWRDGRPHGQRTIIYRGGNVYDGGFQYGKWHGQGTLTLANGDRYQGKWRDGKFLGGDFFAETQRDDYTSTYRNARFAFSIDYPRNIFLPGPEPANGGGITMTSLDGVATLDVWGGNAFYFDDEDQYGDLAVEYKELLARPNLKITYKVMKDKWFVVSGFEGENIFYIKQMNLMEDRSSGQFAKFYFKYPKSSSKLYNPVTKIFSKSFKFLDE